MLTLPSQTEVVAAIDACIDRHSISPTRFGAEATGDGNLVADLRRGVSPRLERLHRINEYIERRDREAGFVEHVSDDTAPTKDASPGKVCEVTGDAA